MLRRAPAVFCKCGVALTVEFPWRRPARDPGGETGVQCLHGHARMVECGLLAVEALCPACYSAAPVPLQRSAAWTCSNMVWWIWRQRAQPRDVGLIDAVSICNSAGCHLPCFAGLCCQIAP